MTAGMPRNISPSSPFRGEREGPGAERWEGEVGVGECSGIPHLTLPSPPPRAERKQKDRLRLGPLPPGRTEDYGSTAGFTLIELVVALALAGVISLLLLQGINLATTGLDRLSRKAEQLAERRRVDTVLRHALAAASA